MRPVEGFPVGDYMVMPMAHEPHRGAWQAGLTLGGETGPGTPHTHQWFFEKKFANQEDALAYATAQAELWASDPDTYLKPRLAR